MKPLVSILFLSLFAFAQTAPKPLPPPGIAIPEDQRERLSARIHELNQHIAKVSSSPHLPDVLVLRDAVRTALTYNEFYKADEVGKANRLLDEAFTRARQLEAGQAPWLTTPGLVVRGYVSQIDGSVQPYGLVIPAGWRPTDATPWRLDAWFHGRNETLTELNFLYERMTRPGEFTPPDAIMLHLYGRYCNANKFAGEMDLFEALAAVKKQYRIDPNRTLVRGFSMGGAATWHIGAHHAGLWTAVAPGAGFAETNEYMRFAEKKEIRPWYEQKLWRWYDATEYAANLFNTAVLAYSGEKDRQIQAANIMARYMAKDGIQLAHVIGPDTEHKYHPDSKVEIEKTLSALARQGRDEYPRQIRFVTYTLRYNEMKWVRVDALDEHWEKATVNASIDDHGDIQIETANTRGISLSFGPAGWRQPVDRPVSVRINGQMAGRISPKSDRSLAASFAKIEGTWQAASSGSTPLEKHHGLQGPIDDAFLSAFLFVLPSGEGMHPQTAAWVKAESALAIKEWRGLFRGEPRVKLDRDVTPEDVANYNLVLWGDPQSNSSTAKVASQLPLTWNREKVQVGTESCPAASCLPLLIFPNPLNPRRYVVLNSGITMRQESNVSNALQTPRLPDVALVDISVPPGPQAPGKVLWADFFNERWQLKAKPAPRLP